MQKTDADLRSHFDVWFRSVRLRFDGRYEQTRLGDTSRAARFDEAERVIGETLTSRGTSWGELAKDWSAHWGSDASAAGTSPQSPAESVISEVLGRIRDIARRSGNRPAEALHQLLALHLDVELPPSGSPAPPSGPHTRCAVPKELAELHVCVVDALRDTSIARRLRDDLWANVISGILGHSSVGQAMRPDRTALPRDAERPPMQPHQPAPAWTWRRPDPSIPSPRPGDWARSPDGVSAGQVLEGGSRFLAASVRGRGHKQDALFCDDTGRFLECGSWRVLIASDGAGGAKFSRVGSQLACDAVVRRLAQELRDCDVAGLTLSVADLKALQDAPVGDPRVSAVFTAIQGAFSDAYADIAAWVADRNAVEPELSKERAFIDAVARGTDSEMRRREPGAAPEAPLVLLTSDLHCTLLACLVVPITFRREDGSCCPIIMTVSCAVGDGMIVAFRRNGLQHPAVMLMAPDTGQFAGQTQFLTDKTSDPDAVRGRIRVQFLGGSDDLSAVVAMTDGVADDYYEGEAAMERLYCDLIVNGLLGCDAGAADVAKERAVAEDALRARAEAAAARMAGLDDEFAPPLQPADDFRKKQLQKSLSQQAAQSTLSSLVRLETVLESLPEGAPPRSVPVKYASAYLDALSLTPGQLLARPALLRAIAECEPRTLPEPADAVDPSASCRAAADRIRRWMDAYIVKGSFDDRTMVVLETGGPA